MPTAAALIRDARHAAGLSQAGLAERVGTTQSAVARLESGRTSPRVDTLERMLAACGRRLQLLSVPQGNVDETLIAEQLRMPPGERLKSFERTYADMRAIALAGEAARGRMA